MAIEFTPDDSDVPRQLPLQFELTAFELYIRMLLMLMMSDIIYLS
jgi:hypothetical protein